MAALPLTGCSSDEPKQELEQLTMAKPNPLPEYKLTPPAGLQAVDLGLSVKWASCNLGAENAEDYGGYFGWGDPTGRCWSTEGLFFTNETGRHGQKKLRWRSSFFGGTNPPATICGTSLDIATVNWGKAWRLPTGREANELCVECDWILEDHGSYKIYKVVGPNGNHIYMPLAGSWGINNGSGGAHFGTRAGWWIGQSALNNTDNGAAAPDDTEDDVYSGWTFCANSELGSREAHTENRWFQLIVRAVHLSVRPVENTLPRY